MNAMFKIILNVLFIVFSLFAIIPVMVSADTITLVADDWCPYNCVPGSQKPGYVVEVAREIFEKSGHEVIYKCLPWKRALSSVMRGSNDGAIGATPGNMPEAVFHKEPIGFYKPAYFVLKENNWNYKSLESLDDQEIGTISGYTYGEPFDEYAKTHKTNIQLLFGDDPAIRNFKKLLRKRINIFIEDLNVGKFIMIKYKIQDNIRIAGFNGVPQIVYIGFSPAKEKSEEYAKTLSAGILEMRKSGRLQQILDKYNLSDWTQ